jgi:HK97 family phage portal protein
MNQLQRMGLEPTPPTFGQFLREKAAWALVNFSRRLSLTDPRGWQDGGRTSTSGESVNETSVLSLATAYACTGINAGTVGSLPFEVHRRNSRGNLELAWDHPLNFVIRVSPGAYETPLGLWEFIQASLELEGNGYARKIIGTGGRLVGLQTIDPGPMDVRRRDGGGRKYIWTEDGRRQEAGEEEVFHVPGFGYGGSALKGISTLAAARQVFGLGLSMDRVVHESYKNGMRPGHALTFAEWLKSDQREIAETRLAEKFVGAVNAGRPMILEGGTKLEALSISPKDAEMLESRRFTVEEICRFFQVPPVLVGHSNVTTWGTGISEIVRGWTILSLRKRVKRIEQSATKQLLTREDRAKGYTVSANLEALLRGDPEARSKYYQTMTQIGAMTINEVRAKEGLPPIPGGDVPRVQTQNQPIVMGTPAELVTPPPPPSGAEG